MKVEFPELSVLEVTKKMAHEWNNMSDESKKPFMEAAEKDKDRWVPWVTNFLRLSVATSQLPLIRGALAWPNETKSIDSLHLAVVFIVSCIVVVASKGENLYFVTKMGSQKKIMELVLATLKNISLSFVKISSIFWISQIQQGEDRIQKEIGK